MTYLFSPLRLRGIELKNRIALSPMCQYSAQEGHPGSWHMVHLGSRALGGASLVMTEATAVQEIGRISPMDTGLYRDSHVDAWRPIAEFIGAQGSVAGVQLAHSGRKGSTAAPWLGGNPLALAAGGWIPVAPSAIPLDTGYTEPRELTVADIDQIVTDFSSAAQRALRAGFQVVEIHGAHGYLLHQFYSPLCNQRDDDYGGSFENRIRLMLRVAGAVRKTWPESQPVLVRISATDWTEDGWDLEQSMELCRRLKDVGIDLVDVSSGGLLPGVQIPAGPGYQTGFAAAIRQQTAMATGAVGMITSPEQAETIIATGQADMVLLAREMLRDPYWPRRAARALEAEIRPPTQYGRAW
jgi:2,4-dienoyl-CoA reductase-like NADH-dependent reductase (Old Yellow Enzyme family)